LDNSSKTTTFAGIKEILKKHATKAVQAVKIPGVSATFTKVPTEELFVLQDGDLVI
jgi:hypothetical protein